MKYGTLAIIAALVPGTLAAQVQSQAQSQTQAQGKTPKARIDAAMHAAAEAKVPASLLKSKVAEGEAKRVPEDRIATAVEARLRALLRASTTLKRADVAQHSASDLAVTADALESGVNESALVRITKSAPEERRVVAIAVLSDLVRLGHTSDAALAQVTAAVTTSTALANLNAQVASQLRLGGLSSTLDAAGILRIP
jgi:hypothetical protein